MASGPLGDWQDSPCPARCWASFSSNGHLLLGLQLGLLGPKQLSSPMSFSLASPTSWSLAPMDRESCQGTSTSPSHSNNEPLGFQRVDHASRHLHRTPHPTNRESSFVDQIWLSLEAAALLHHVAIRPVFKGHNTLPALSLSCQGYDLPMLASPSKVAMVHMTRATRRFRTFNQTTPHQLTQRGPNPSSATLSLQRTMRSLFFHRAAKVGSTNHAPCADGSQAQLQTSA